MLYFLRGPKAQKFFMQLLASAGTCLAYNKKCDLGNNQLHWKKHHPAQNRDVVFVFFTLLSLT